MWLVVGLGLGLVVGLGGGFVVWLVAGIVLEPGLGFVPGLVFGLVGLVLWFAVGRRSGFPQRIGPVRWHEVFRREVRGRVLWGLV